MTKIHAHALKHGLSKEDITFAWNGYHIGAVRVLGEREVRFGFDRRGRELEIIGVLLEDGEWLIYHALTPPTARMRQEIEHARKRM